MATTTPNFGWAVPTSTDLVKDGAVAIETLGDSIDASLVDLKGGTTGQVLAKTTNTDMDFIWTTPQVGDITGVTAGTGISGGGTSGTVTVTNDMATTITTSGDLIYGTGSGTYTRRGIGSTGQVLTVTGGVPTWATPAAGGAAFVGAVVFNTSDISLANNTTVVATFNSERVDTNGFHSTSTNTSRITIPAGYGGQYAIWCDLEYAASAIGIRSVRLYINAGYPGSTSATQIVNATTAGEAQNGFFFYRNLSVGDYVELAVRQTSGGSLDLGGSGSGYMNQFGVQYLGA